GDKGQDEGGWEGAGGMGGAGGAPGPRRYLERRSWRHRAGCGADRLHCALGQPLDRGDQQGSDYNRLSGHFQNPVCRRTYKRTPLHSPWHLRREDLKYCTQRTRRPRGTLVVRWFNSLSGQEAVSRTAWNSLSATERVCPYVFTFHSPRAWVNADEHDPTFWDSRMLRMKTAQ